MLSPTSTTILALHPVRSVPPHTLALALLSSPTGVQLTHIDLASETLTAVGEETLLGDMHFSGGVEMVISQGVERGQMGLVALISEDVGAMLVVSPRLKRESFDSNY